MKARGVIAEADWDGSTLRARGRGRASHKRLAGDIANEGDVIIPKNQIVRAYFRDATLATNGLLGVRTKDERRFDLVFRRKHADAFREIARDLGAI